MLKRLYDIFRAHVGHRLAEKKKGFEENEYGECDHSYATDDYAQPCEDPIIAKYYANLELPYGASVSDIKKNYRILMQKYHPDRFSNDLSKKEVAERITKGLNEAYDYFKQNGVR